MVAMQLMFIGFDEYLADPFFRELHRDVHVMTDGIFAVVNDIALNSAQYTMVEMEALFGQGMFQSLKRVVFQIVSDTQRVCDVAKLDLAVWQTGQKLVGANGLTGGVLTEYDIALF